MVKVPGGTAEAPRALRACQDAPDEADFREAVDDAAKAVVKLDAEPAEEAPRGGGGGALVPEDIAEEVTRWRRIQCPSCQQSAMFYCPFCCMPLGVPDGVTVPRVQLPFGRCDIIFDDAPKKATSIHAKVLAPTQVRLVDLFTNDTNSNRTLSRHGMALAEEFPATAVVREVPEYDPKDSWVLFPDEGSVPSDEVFNVARPGLTLVVIDAPWRRAQVLRRHPRLAPLRSVRLREPPSSRFWRYHSEGAGCISTVEALAALVREISLEQGECSTQPVEPWGEPLLFLFARQFAHIAAQQRDDGLELPTEQAAKDRRSARVRQKDHVKRLRPLSANAKGTQEKCSRSQS